MAAQQCWDHLGGQRPPWVNTVHLTNLPLGTTEGELLDRLMITQGFGRLYSLHIKTVWRPYEPPMVEGLVAFFSQEAAQLLINYVNCYGILFNGHLINASWTHFKAPDADLPDHPNASRALIVSGPKFFVTETDVVAFLDKKLNGALVKFQTIQVRNKKGYRKLLLVFTTFSAARRARAALSQWEDGVTVEYGRDPLETGAKVGISKRDPNNMEIQWGDWDYPDSESTPIVKDQKVPSPSAVQTKTCQTEGSNTQNMMSGAIRPLNADGKKEKAAIPPPPTPFYIRRADDSNTSLMTSTTPVGDRKTDCADKNPSVLKPSKKVSNTPRRGWNESDTGDDVEILYERKDGEPPISAAEVLDPCLTM